MFKFHKIGIWIACWSLCLCAQNLDSFTIQSGNMAAGATQEFPIYYRDLSGTLLDSDRHDLFAMFIRIQMTAGKVTAAGFRQAGITANNYNEQFNHFDTGSNQAIWFFLFPSRPSFNMNASSPGDLIGYFSLTTATNATGSITLEAGSDTLVQDFNETTQSISAGNLAAQFGPISIGSGGNPPQIQSFSLSPSSITQGGTSTLSWQVSGATTIAIDQGIGTVSASGTRSVNPTSTTTYTMTATNSSGTANATATLTVSAPSAPVIQQFSANPLQILAGESSTLSWNVLNASSISLSPGIGSVNSSGSRTVSPSATTTYTLTASNGSQTATAQVVIAVSSSGSRPLIRRFESTPNPVAFGQNFTLSWEVQDGTAWRIEDGGAHRYMLNTGSGTMVLAADAENLPGDTTFTLIASNTAGDSQASTQLRLGKILAFTADQTEIVRGQPVTLAWQVQNATSVTLSPGSGTVPASSSTTVSPTVTTTYRLTAQIGSFALSEEILIQVRDSDALYFPLLKADGLFQSDIHVVNLEANPLNYQWTLYSASGAVLSGPTLGTLPAQGTFSQTISSLSGGKGWAEFRAQGLESAKMVGVANLRSLDGKELESYSAMKEPTSEILVPHVAADPAFYTQASCVNLGEDSSAFEYETGSQVFGFGTLDPTEQASFDFRQLMNGTIQGNGWGTIRAVGAATTGAAVEIFGRVGQAQRQSVAVSLDNQTGTSLYFAHIANPANFWTGIVLINVGDSPTQIRFQAYNDAGQPVSGGRAPETLPAGQKKTFLVFGSQLDFGSGAAWVKVESDLPITGYQLFGAYGDRDVFSGFESVKEPVRKICFVYLEDSRSVDAFTGIAIVNPSSLSNLITFSLVDSNGSLKRQVQKTLNPNQKFISLVRDLFPVTVASGDKVLAQALQPIVAFQIYGEGTQTLGGVLAQSY